MSDTDLPPAAQRAIEAFELRIDDVLGVPESYASVVRILRLEGGEEVVLKLPSSEVKQRREIAALRALRDWSLTPNVLDERTFQDGSCAMLLSRLPGTVIGDASQLNSHLTAEIGAALARIHSVRVPNLEGGDGPDAWWRGLHSTFGRCLGECRTHATHPQIELAAEIGLRILDGPPPVEEAHLVHFDYRLGNLLHEGDRLTGVLDFESARMGSGGMDYTKLAREVWSVRPELRPVMLSAYETIRPLPEPVDRALSRYDLYHAVAGMAWCLRREKYDDPFLEFNRAGLTSALERIERNEERT